jgi:MFS family permease
MAFAVQLLATLVSGPLIDRRGARLALRAGPALYLGAALIFFVSSAPAAIGLARVLQGVGIALIVPAAFALLPSLVSPAVRGTALGAFGVSQNLALAAGPPVGLWLLRRGAAVLFAVAIATSAVSLLLSLLLRVGVPSDVRKELFAFRRAWAPLFLVTFLTVVYWGVVTAFLPIHVPAGQLAGVGWFFSADALAVLACRIPAGYLSDHYGPRWPLMSGILVTVLAIGLLTFPPSLVMLVLAGIGTGAGAALLLPPILLELANRSADSERGTAMALFYTSFAAAVGLGSLAFAPVVQRLGFQAALWISALICLLSLPVVIRLPAHAHR